MDHHINFIEGGYSRVGRELQEKREEQEVLRLWRQIWILMTGLITYAAISSLWGQKILYLVSVAIVFLIIGKLNKI